MTEWTAWIMRFGSSGEDGVLMCVVRTWLVVVEVLIGKGDKV